MLFHPRGKKLMLIPAANPSEDQTTVAAPRRVAVARPPSPDHLPAPHLLKQTLPRLPSSLLQTCQNPFTTIFTNEFINLQGNACNPPRIMEIEVALTKPLQPSE
jgi:hypothetical protein